MTSWILAEKEKPPSVWQQFFFGWYPLGIHNIIQYNLIGTGKRCVPSALSFRCVWDLWPPRQGSQLQTCLAHPMGSEHCSKNAIGCKTSESALSFYDCKFFTWKPIVYFNDWNCKSSENQKEHKGRWYHSSRDTRQSLDLPWYHIFFCGWHLSDIKSRKTLIYFKIYVFCLTFVWRGNGHFCAIFVKHL